MRKLSLYLICMLLSWITKFAIEHGFKLLTGKEIGGEILFEYISPTTVLCAVALVSLFANLKLNRITAKFTKFFAPAAIGVYLGHASKPLRNTVLTDKFSSYAAMNLFLMALAVLSTALAIWLAFSLIDRLRLVLFDLLGVRGFSRN